MAGTRDERALDDESRQHDFSRQFGDLLPSNEQHDRQKGVARSGNHRLSRGDCRIGQSDPGLVAEVDSRSTYIRANSSMRRL